MPAKLVNGMRLLLCAVVLLAPAGCGSGTKLETNAVKGRVVFEKGGTVRKLHEAEAAVVFESVNPPGIRATAAIAEDGSLTNFVSKSSKGESSGYGLVKGTYRVRIDLDAEHRGLVNPRFLSFDKSE